MLIELTISTIELAAWSLSLGRKQRHDCAETLSRIIGVRSVWDVLFALTWKSRCWIICGSSFIPKMFLLHSLVSEVLLRWEEDIVEYLIAIFLSLSWDKSGNLEIRAIVKCNYSFNLRLADWIFRLRAKPESSFYRNPTLPGLSFVELRLALGKWEDERDDIRNGHKGIKMKFILCDKEDIFRCR